MTLGLAVHALHYSDITYMYVQLWSIMCQVNVLLLVGYNMHVLLHVGGNSAILWRALRRSLQLVL